jgi:hypothetical protein
MQAHSAVIAGVAIAAAGDFHKSWKYPGVNLQAHTAVSRVSHQAKSAVFSAVAPATPTA